MASWVITISKDFPQHWDYARQHGVWDMSKNFPIRSGDLVYFRIARSGLLGQSEATSDARPMTPSDKVPWDDGRDPYTTRFTFHLLSDQPMRADHWGVTAARLTKSPVMQVPRSWNDTADEAVLASYFPRLPQQSAWEAFVWSMIEPETSVEASIDLADLDNDEKKVAMVAQTVREGRDQFRAALVAAYDSKCAITGTEVEPALDAAHIRPYSGPKSNILPNGLLLRGDIHRLFDKHRLTVVATAVCLDVRVDPSLSGTTYADLDGRALVALPSEPAHRPSVQLLQEHNAKCAWLAT